MKFGISLQSKPDRDSTLEEVEPEPTDLADVQTDQSDGVQPSEMSDEVARIPSPLSEISPGTGTNDTPVDEQEQVNELGVKDTASGSEEIINE